MKSAFTSRLRIPAIRPAEFAERRQKLIERLKSHAKASPVVVLRGNLTTLLGPRRAAPLPAVFALPLPLRLPHARLRARADRPEVHSCSSDNKARHELLWEGRAKSMDDLQEGAAMDEVLPLSELPAFLAAELKPDCSLAADGRKHEDALVQRLLDGFNGERLHLFEAIDRLRWVKSADEVAIARAAAQIGGEALNAAMQQSKGIPDENTLHGLLEFEMRRRGAECMAYPPVIAGGNRANTIHYLDANREFAENDCVLIDAGASLHGYCSDITRCFPISGRFTPAPSELYDALHSIQEECLDFVRKTRPLKLSDLFLHMVGAMAEVLGSMRFFVGETNSEQLIRACERLCPHHISHYLGNGRPRHAHRLRERSPSSRE
ncbi:putative Xaa-Pro aminopeptidase 3 [Aphelenchoides fujianensis]|nr:putative Xaa-Pro aminopeptidase 3 [Aphelenchoides fujianensis]